jgi:hypothetical protein
MDRNSIKLGLAGLLTAGALSVLAEWSVSR